MVNKCSFMLIYFQVLEFKMSNCSQKATVERNTLTSYYNLHSTHPKNDSDSCKTVIHKTHVFYKERNLNYIMTNNDDVELTL